MKTIEKCGSFMKGKINTPFENFIHSLMSSKSMKVKDIHPEDFLIIMDSILALIFKSDGLTKLKSTRIEFSSRIKYPYSSKNYDENLRTIYLPDNNEPEEIKQLMATEALKSFDCLDVIEKYELCLRIFHSFSEPELTMLAKEFDPYKRDTSKLEERLSKRMMNQKEQNENSGS